MNNKILLDENKQYKFDFTNTKYALELHELAKSLMVYDVDFITETNDEILFIEYKNADIKNAIKPDAILQKINTDKFINNISKKYYDSLLLFWGRGYNEDKKDIKYVFILQHPKIDLRVRKQLRNKLRDKLPMKRENREVIKGYLSEFEIYNIDEWNKRFKDIEISPVEI